MIGQSNRTFLSAKVVPGISEFVNAGKGYAQYSIMMLQSLCKESLLGHFNAVGLQATVMLQLRGRTVCQTTLASSSSVCILI